MTREGIEQRSQALLREGEDYLRTHPGVALASAVALGFTLGLIARSLEKKPEPEPIRDALREIGSLISPFANRTRRAYSESSDVVRDAVEAAVEKARDFDADRYARPVSRWWHRLWA